MVPTLGLTQSTLKKGRKESLQKGRKWINVTIILLIGPTEEKEVRTGVGFASSVIPI